MFRGDMKRATIHVLLVDDCEAHARQVKQSLELQAGQFEVVVLRTLAETRHCLRDLRPDLVITEWRLPDGKGLELLAGRDGGDYPVIIMTSCGSERAAVESIKSGAIDYIVKSAAALAGLSSAVDQGLREWGEIIKRRQGEESFRKAEDSSCSSEEKFRTFFECAAAGMVTLSTEGRIVSANAAFCRFIGYSSLELASLSVADITYSDDLEETANAYRRLGGGESRAISYRKRFLCKGGAVVWGHVSVAAVFVDEGCPQYYVGLVQDITEHKQVQDQIRESQQMLQLILDNIPQYVFWKDRNSVYLGCNRHFARGAGVGVPQNLIGKNDYDLPWTHAEAESYRECDQRIMVSGRPKLQFIETQLQADGRQVWVETNKVPLRDGEGHVVGVLGTFEDITERKRAQDDLVAANRELDAFVYTVSHDLRTPLTPIISYAEVLKDTYRDRLDAQALDWLGKIEKQGRRMLAVLEDLLLLARVGHLGRPIELIDPNIVLEDVLVGMGGGLAEAGVVVEKKPLPKLKVPETLVAQLFGNLIGNAVRYAGKGGSPIVVEGERRGNLVRLAVRDHGPGIPSAERSQIFELFYRGAASRKSSGTGVGLAIVQKISRLFEGRAWVEETPGGGSTFLVELMDC